jgi:cell division septum initiation protein DivIVA
MPMPGDEDADLVPHGYRFDVVWRGFNRRQVREYLDIELGMLTTDRNAAMATMCDLAELLEQSRAEIDDLRERLDRVCQASLPPASVDERLRRLGELAHDEAAAIVASARETAERLQGASLERIRLQGERTERRRQEIEDDFQIAMAARRTEAMRALAEYETTRRAEADRLVREADEVARRRIASATTQVNALRETHRRLAGRLRTVRGMLVRACALVGPPAQT